MVNFALFGDGIEEYEILLECFRLRGNFAFSSEGDAGAIEDEGIVTADLIDVDDRTLVMQSGRTQHLEAQGAFVDGIGRGGYVDEEASALRDELRDRVAGVARLGPESFV